MIAPYQHRTSIEIQNSVVNSVVAEVNQRSCRIVKCVSVDMQGSKASDMERLRRTLEDIRHYLPGGVARASASVVLPPDRVIESSIQVPVSRHIDKYEWENWELTMLMADQDEDYLYESYHLETSPCRNFNTRMITAVRKSYVDELLSAAYAAGFSIDQIFFPQQLWKQVLINAYPEDAARIDCLYIGTGSANLIAMEPGGPARMSTTEISENDKSRLPETVESFLSWCGQNPRSASVRALVNSSRSSEQIDRVASRMEFTAFDLSRLPGDLLSAVGNPERYLLPLSALGLV